MATYPQYFQLGQNLPKTVGGPLPIGTPDYIIKMLEAAGVQPAPAYSQARPVPMPVVRAAEAIRSIESSNNYRALGPTIDDPNSMYYGDRAYGAYQVMGKNIGPWTREVLGKEMTPEEFLADRAAQDRVFQAKFGQSFSKHGNLEDAASTWFTGQPLSRGAGRSDTLGTTGSEYVDRFLKALPSEEGDPMDIRNMAALQPAQPQPAQPQQSRMAGLLSDPALFENLALAFNTLRMTPDENLATVIRGRQERRADTATRNRTIEFLRQRGREDLAAAVESGAIDAKTAAAQVFAKPAMQQNYEFLVAKGMKPEQALQAAQSGTIVNVGGESSEFRKASEKELATQIGGMASEGLSAQRNLGLVNELDRVLQQAPQGFGGALVGMAGNLGLELGEGAGAVQAAQAIINRLVPQQRQPGSGPMSDADLALFKQSLPRIINQPEGNRRIIDTLKAIAQYDIDRGNIARRAQIGEITPYEALQQIQSLPNPLDWVRSMSTQAPTEADRDAAVRALLGG